MRWMSGCAAEALPAGGSSLTAVPCDDPERVAVQHESVPSVRPASQPICEPSSPFFPLFLQMIIKCPPPTTPTYPPNMDNQWRGTCVVGDMGVWATCLCSLLVRPSCALCLCSSSTDESDRIELMIGSSGCMNTDGRGQVFCLYQGSVAFQKLFCKKFIMILCK